MTNDEINLKVSNLRAPLNTLDVPHRFSESENWVPDNAGPWDDGSTTVPWYWSPRDWTGSEEASAVLRDELIVKHRVRFFTLMRRVYRNADRRDRITGAAWRRVIALSWIAAQEII